MFHAEGEDTKFGWVDWKAKWGRYFTATGKDQIYYCIFWSGYEESYGSDNMKPPGARRWVGVMIAISSQHFLFT